MVDVETIQHFLYRDYPDEVWKEKWNVNNNWWGC
jgi:hypothetical protein